MLVAALTNLIRAHVILSEEAALVAALWIILAWAHDAAVHSPILLVTSPEKECGKSTLLGVISFLVPSGLIMVNPTPQVLYRMIESWHPTMLVDEADSMFKDNADLRDVFNSGWTRNSGVPRCNPDTNEPEFFSTFGPKVIGIKGLKLPDTTLSRCIIIQLQRKLPQERAAEFEHLDSPEMAQLRSKAKRWSEDNLAKLRGVKPKMPGGFHNRLAANWRLIFAIADLCGVGDKARAAAVSVSDRDDEPSLAVELITDIRTIFDRLKVDRIKRDELVTRLVALEDRPWSEMPYTHKEMTAAQMRKLLKTLYVKVGDHRFDGKTARGVLRSDFESLWKRYIRPSPDIKCDAVISAENSQKKCDAGNGSITLFSTENSQNHTITPDFPPQADPTCPACDGAGCPSCLGLTEWHRLRNGH